jgi:hypothetical protein
MPKIEQDKFDRKLRPFYDLIDFILGQFNVFFWVLSIITIPLFAYIYYLPMLLVVWLLSKAGLDFRILLRTSQITSLIFAIGTQFYMWKLYKDKTK